MALKKADNRKIMTLKPELGAFGFPPSTYLSDDMIRNSMPIIEFYPAEPDFSSGLSLFTIDMGKGEQNYKKILNLHGFSTELPIRAAFIADNFPTDTFSNEYTETFLQKFTDVASSGLSQIIQMSGETNALDALQSYGTDLQKAGEAFGGTMGSMAGTVGKKAAETAKQIQEFMKSKKSGAFARTLGGGINLVNKMLAGHRIDFPQIWSNSGFAPSYSVTIRLYNPFPGQIESTKRYIVGPLACFLCLATPRSENGYAYRWPFYHKIRVTGLYELNPAVITSMTIVKGGDQQQIAFNQNLSMCDLRIDFQPLHKSMVLETANHKFPNRPTVKSYLDQLSSNDTRNYERRDQMRSNISKRLNNITPELQPFATSEEFLANQAAARREAQAREIEAEKKRVADLEAIKQRALALKTNPGFVVPNIKGTSLINLE